VGFAEEVVEGVLQKAEAAGLLDDTIFARLWVEDRLFHHPISRRAVQRELSEKGVAPETVEQVLDALYPSEKEKQLALQLAQTRYERTRGITQAQRARRTVAYLTRRGFHLSLAKRIVRALENQESEEDG
jgi:regulatory protein